MRIVFMTLLCLHLEHPDLPQSDLLDDGIVFRLHKLLDGDDLSRVFVPALEHNAVRTLPDLRYLLVLLHHNVKQKNPGESTESAA